MTRTQHLLALLALCAAAQLPGTDAQAQWYHTPPTPPPLYPYELQPGQPYAIEVAPNTYVIQRPRRSQRAYPYVRPAARPEPRQARVSRAPKFDRPPKPADRKLIEELRKGKVERSVIHTKKIVREKPIVIETRRVVDDPPRVVERYHYVDDPPLPPPSPRKRVTVRHGGRDLQQGRSGGNRVIHADAVVTILGPDRMVIRLTRKGDDANALALPARK